LDGPGPGSDTRSWNAIGVFMRVVRIIMMSFHCSTQHWHLLREYIYYIALAGVERLFGIPLSLLELVELKEIVARGGLDLLSGRRIYI